MAITVDQASLGTPAANDASGTSISFTTSVAIAAGATAVISVGWWHASATLSTVTIDGNSATIGFQAKHSSQNVQAGKAYLYFAGGLASGKTVTATFSAAVTGRQIGGSSFTGVASSSPLGATNDNAGGVSPWSSDSTTILAGSLLTVTSHLDESRTLTITSPSVQALNWGDGANTSQQTGYRIESSAGAYTVAGTFTGGNANWVAVGIELKAAAGGTNQTVTAVAAAATGAAPAAVITGSGTNQTVSGVVALGLGSAPAAATSAGATVAGVPALALGSAPPANQILSVVINAPAVIATGSAPAAIPSVPGVGADVPAVTALGLGSAPVATLTWGSTVSAVAALAASSAPAASVLQGAGVTAVAANATGQAPRPQISPAPAGGSGNAGDVAATFAEAGT